MHQKVKKTQAVYQINSKAQYEEQCQYARDNNQKFWDEIAANFIWQKKWHKTYEYDFSKGSTKFFCGGKLNITQNCLDENAKKNPNKCAIIFEANEENQSSIKITYQELLDKTCQMANILKNNGIKKGDRVCIYMPMIIDSIVATLACARIGAIHSIVFAGFSASSLQDRINDLQAKMVITADILNRGSKQIKIKEEIVDEAVKNCPSIAKILVFQRQSDFKSSSNKDILYHQELTKVSNNCPAEILDSEDELFVLYTSGSTGKPKGVVHSCGGYMVYSAYSFANVFNYQENDIFFCTADIGWITGHSYLIYGPLLNNATILMYEGIPTYPDASRFWKIIDKHQVNIFYTAPTAIRSLMNQGDKFTQGHDLSSLKTLGTVGEPINFEAYNWYKNKIGNNKCAIVDTWWQTETGGILISNLAHTTTSNPTCAGSPLPGIEPILLNKDGKEINQNNIEGYLTFKHPWPSLARTTWGNHTRFKEVYFNNYPDYYFAGDAAKKDKDGFFRIIGRIDDVINSSGHRFGTAEIEDAINKSKLIVESAVISYPHKIKGEGICAFVIANKEQEYDEEEIKFETINQVVNNISKIARPDKIIIVSDLPKTRSGKIMRRILKKLVNQEFDQLGDTTTLVNPKIIKEIAKKM